MLATRFRSRKMACRPTLLLTLLLAMTTLAPLAMAASGDDGLDFGGDFGPPPVPIRLELLADQAVAGETVAVAAVYSVPEGTHLTDTFFTVEFSSDPPLSFEAPRYPAAIMHGEDRIFRGETAVWTLVTLPESGTVTLNARAEFQICQEGEVEMCFPPDEATPTLSLQLQPAGTSWTPLAKAGLAVADFSGSAGDAPVAASTELAEVGGLEGKLTRALNQGSWLAFLLVFLGGVLTSFTPCVYPVIPMTITYIGGSSKGNPLKGFILSLWFALGIALVYSTLGLLAAAGGGAFGQATQNPWVNGGIAVLIGAMGFSMAGLFDLQLPSSVTSKVGGARTGFLGPLLMGAATGLIAAPCVGPVLVVLLTWVATTGSLFLGFWLLFTFALGLGLLFIVLGTFSGAISALPGAGAWMDTVKHFFAILLWGLALWFLRSLLPGWLLTMAFGLALVMSLGAWGAFRPLADSSTHKQGLIKGLMLLFWILGVILAIGGGLRGFAPGLLPSGGGVATGTTAAAHVEPDWIWDMDAGFAEAAASGKPVMMDFWAEWCAACKELDHKTYNQPEILSLAAQFTSIKVDMTEKSEANAAVQKHYGVVGMPTVIFFDSAGNELTRFAGFKKAEDLAPILEQVLANH
jgi:thioredoxin:protein disulfide reductase